MKRQSRMVDPAPVTPFGQPPNNEVIDTATLKLLESWQRQDATDDPDEVSAAEQELAEFKKAMDENRSLSGEPLLYP